MLNTEGQYTWEEVLGAEENNMGIFYVCLFVAKRSRSFSSESFRRNSATTWSCGHEGQTPDSQNHGTEAGSPCRNGQVRRPWHLWHHHQVSLLIKRTLDIDISLQVIVMNGKWEEKKTKDKCAQRAADTDAPRWLQSQASALAVERPYRARLPRPVGVSQRGRLSCPWGLQAVGFGAGTGRGMLVGLVGRSCGEASVIQKMIAVRTWLHLGRCDFLFVKRLIMIVSGNW